jgi:hypothetical protein
METVYKGWRIAVRTKNAADAEEWRVYADVSRDDASRVRMRKPLSFKDGRTFSTENAAESAALELAKAFIDHAV